MSATKRLLKELKDIQNSTTGEFTASLVKTDDPLKWKASICGPPGTPYEGGVFELTFNFPSSYPFQPPNARFVTKIFHPNISSSGSICLDILKDQWSPVLTVPKVLISILSLLDDPEPSDPLVPEIAELYINDRAAHDVQAREWTEMYAK